MEGSNPIPPGGSGPYYVPPSNAGQPGYAATFGAPPTLTQVPREMTASHVVLPPANQSARKMPPRRYSHESGAYAFPLPPGAPTTQTATFAGHSVTYKPPGSGPTHHLAK